MESRTKLKLATYRAHTRGRRAICAWCGDPVSRTCFDLHEALVKRGEVSKDKQYLIMVIENCVPLHILCHTNHGHSTSMKVRCLDALVYVLSARRIGQWYTSLWQEHELILPRGIPPADDTETSWFEYLLGVIGYNNGGHT